MGKLLSLLARALRMGYPDYYSVAYDEGHIDGKQEGFQEGRDAGENHGYWRARETVAEWNERDRDH